MKKYVWYLVAFVAGAALCGALVLWLSNGASTKLRSDLDAARTALDSALASNGRLADANRRLNEGLQNASDLVAGQQRTIAEQKQRIGDQQRELERQKSIIGTQQLDLDAAKRGLGELAESLASGLGDLRSRAEAIRECVVRLFAIYHPSSG